MGRRGRGRPALERSPARGGAAIGLAILGVGLFAAGGRRGLSAAVAAGLLAGVGGAWVAAGPAIDAPAVVDRSTFLIDSSHLPAVGHYEARVNPSGSLDTNLLRAGLRVSYLDSWDGAAVGRSRGVGLIAPRRPFARGEVDDLIRLEEGGGVVILAVGHPDAGASRSLLSAHGLAIAARPLGTVPDAGDGAVEKPRFLDAWPIVADADGGDPARLPGVDVVYRDGADVVALFRRRGLGGLLLIADTRFFSSMNIEDVSDHRVGNLAMIHDLFRKYLGADPDSVRPAFDSPTKPD